jgi:hypothetical protein
MAGRYGPSSVWLYIDGYNVTNNAVKNLTVTHEATQEDVTGLTDTAKSFSPTGISSVTVEMDGAIWDTGTDQIHTALGPATIPTTPQSAVRTALIGMAGLAKGVMAYGTQEFQTNFDVLATNDELTKANAGFQCTGPLDLCVLLDSRTATGDYDTESSSVDNAASSSAGGVSYLQCTAYSGFSGAVFKVRDSSDDASFSDLVTHTTLTALGAERKTVAGTVDRYLAVKGDVTGSGSVTATLAFRRL